MLAHGLIRIGFIVACLLPSLTCFGLAGYLVNAGVAKGWGWFLLVGLLCADIPRRLFRLPEECPSCHSRRGKGKPEPYFEAEEIAA